MFLSEWREFHSAPCFVRRKNKLDDSSRLDVVEIARVPDMLPSLFPSWSGQGLISTPVNPLHIFTAKSPKLHFTIPPPPPKPPLWHSFYVPGKLEEHNLRINYGRFLPNYCKFTIHLYITHNIIYVYIMYIYIYI